MSLRAALYHHWGKDMDPTVGLILLIGFPLALVVAIWAFGSFSKEPE